MFPVEFRYVSIPSLMGRLLGWTQSRVLYSEELLSQYPR